MRLLPAVVFALALPAFAQAQCTYSVVPTTITAPPDGISSVNPTKITVTTPDGCAWSAAVPQSSPWVHVGIFSGTGSSGNNATGNGLATIFVDPNPTPVTRGGSVLVAGQIVTIAQGGANCSYTLSPTTARFSAAGGPGSAAVQTSCVWGAGTTTTWITVPRTAGGSSSGTLNYTVATNRCIDPRTDGVIVVGYPGASGPPFLTTLPVTQDGDPNALTVSPTSLTFSNAATTGSIVITAPIGCGWSASSDVSWVQLTPPLSASGPGQIAYRILANTNVARTGNIHVGPFVIPVSQQGAALPTAQINAVTNGATNQAGAVSPGEIVVLYGVNLGPATLATLQLTPDGSSVTKTLAGTQVLFDGTPGAMIYTRSNQVSAVVPYGVAVNGNTQIQVSYNGLTTPAASVPVQPATPAIFTQDASGIGPGAILNQDFQLNSASTRAGRGEAIMIYCTGAGITNPPSADGAVVAAPYPQLTQPVSVTIGGINAPILYSGAAPGSIAGLTQINAQVPSAVTPSTAVPIVVKIGNWTSQPGVTVAVK